ncbi:hypothetical protein OS493_039623, partial [Desmophyllum pertusum]
MTVKVDCSANRVQNLDRPFSGLEMGVLISYGINSRYMIQLDGTLLIKKVDKDKDSVNYTCKAENMLGQDSATTVPVVY